MNRQDYAASLAPVWLRDPEHQGDLRARAVPLDELVMRLRTIMLARLVNDAPEDALALIGQERGLKRFKGEPVGVYRARVTNAWAYWRAAGTLPGMTYILRVAGWNAYVLEHFRDPDRARWAEFSIHVIPVNPPVKDAFWGRENRFGDGASHWGYRIDALPVSSLVELINEIKPAHARLRRLTFSVGGNVWGGGGVWGNTTRVSEAHPWGSIWGLPQITTLVTGESSMTWGDGSTQTVYDLNDSTAIGGTS